MPTIPDEVLQASIVTAAQYARLTKGARALLDRRIEQAIALLISELTGPAALSTYRRSQASFALLALSAANSLTVSAVSEVLGKVMQAGVIAGVADAETELRAWLVHYGLENKPLNIAAASQASAESLVSRHASSMARYGKRQEAYVRQAVSRAMLTRRGPDYVAYDLKRQLKLREYQAQRLVRTEFSHAYNSSHLNGLIEADEQLDGEVKKTCIITRDGRTAADSYVMDGQVRALDDMFTDGAGRSFLSPPGRPNDREKQLAHFEP